MKRRLRKTNRRRGKERENKKDLKPILGIFYSLGQQKRIEKNFHICSLIFVNLNKENNIC